MRPAMSTSSFRPGNAARPVENLDLHALELDSQRPATRSERYADFAVRLLIIGLAALWLLI